MEATTLSDREKEIFSKCQDMLDFASFLNQAGSLMRCVRDSMRIRDASDVFTPDALDGILFIVEGFQNVYEKELRDVLALYEKEGA